VAVFLMTAGFWMLKQPTSSVVRAQSTLGGPLPNLTALETTMFNTGMQPFNKIWDPQNGLGPVYTQINCNGCHSSPAMGGNSNKKQTFFGSINTDGTFNPLTSEGGIQLQNQSVSRFKPNCVLSGESLPADATIVAKHLSPPLFGLGLVDNIADADIQAQAIDKGMGVHGIAGMVTDQNGNLRVGRFGYKAEFATLVQATAEALQHDIGITNPISPVEDLPNGNPIPPFCSTSAEPNDPTGLQMVDTFHFIAYLAPNTPGTGNANGQALFSSIGCALCHLPSYTTQANVVMPVVWNGRTIISKALSQQPVNLYSDLLLHDMGTLLADGISMGSGTSTQFRTTPLWGISARLANGNGLLHDGRTTNLTTAITTHGGEAATVVANFNALSPSDQADLLAFVSSL
jgi:CxxC motif-containing protein (DUF1111 family)